MSLTRRDFIKTSALSGVAVASGGGHLLFKNSADAAKEGLIEPPLPGIDVGGFIRPPGALPEIDFRAKCISCGVCVNICHVMKYNAIVTAGLIDIRNFGTPYIKDMRDFPCYLCMECPSRCPTGSLREIEKEKVTMGMALIDFGLCFGYNGDICLSCSKACPLGGIVFDFHHGIWGNQPFINENCVGCGLCVKYCPLGGSAVKVVTMNQHKEVKASYLDELKSLLAMSHEERFSIVFDQNLPRIIARGKLVEREH